MKSSSVFPRRAVWILTAASVFAVSMPSFAMAQASPDQQAPGQADSGGWRKLGQGNGSSSTAKPAAPAPANSDSADPGFQQGAPPANGRQAPSTPQQPPPLPSVLTIPRGAYFTIRTNEVLSSDRNHEGDEFTASLVKPIVVDGIVVADRGQTIAGHVDEAQKAGMVKGQSKLAITLDQITLADGTQVPVRASLTGFSGGTSIGRDATAIGTTSALGAIIGAAADGGAGAGIGAGAGAGAALIGVLLTRGNPTVIAPETVLTFRTEAPIRVSTDRAPQAFRDVAPGDYDQPQDRPRMQTGPVRRPPVYGPYPYPYPYPYYGPGWYGYPYYGPGVGVGVVIGPHYRYRRW